MIRVEDLSERDRGRLVRYLPTGGLGTLEDWRTGGRDGITVAIISVNDNRPDGGVATVIPQFRVRVTEDQLEWLGGEICDFCSAAPVVHTFACQDFDIPLVGRSRGGFMACADCKGLVETGDRKTLAARALERYGDDARLLLFHAQVRALHDAFFEHRLPGSTLREEP
jgi:hypothetical protein